MIGWAALVLAILLEVAGTLMMRASDGLRRRRWIAPVAACYLAAFSLLAVVLSSGIPLGAAYGIWAASGVALTAVVAHLRFGEPLTRRMGAGIALIVVGVLVIEAGMQA